MSLSIAAFQVAALPADARDVVADAWSRFCRGEIDRAAFDQIEARTLADRISSYLATAPASPISTPHPLDREDVAEEKRP